MQSKTTAQAIQHKINIKTQQFIVIISLICPDGTLLIAGVRHGTQSQLEQDKVEKCKSDTTTQNDSSLTVAYNFLVFEMNCGQICLPMLTFVHHLMSWDMQICRLDVNLEIMGPQL